MQNPLWLARKKQSFVKDREQRLDFDTLRRSFPYYHGTSVFSMGIFRLQLRKTNLECIMKESMTFTPHTILCLSNLAIDACLASSTLRSDVPVAEADTFQSLASALPPTVSPQKLN